VVGLPTRVQWFTRSDSLTIRSQRGVHRQRRPKAVPHFAQPRRRRRGMQAWSVYYFAGHSTDDIRAQILASPEYQADHGGANGFLSALYQDVLHRDIDAGGTAYWGHALASGMSRQQAANALLHSSEAETSTVRNLYTQYLRVPATMAASITLSL